jgi:NADH:ubiquinone oxidoreductase subunit 4 (subunit M)
MYGPITPTIVNFADLSYKEIFVLAPLVVLTIYLGLFPNYIFSQLTDICTLLLENYQ